MPREPTPTASGVRPLHCFSRLWHLPADQSHRDINPKHIRTGVRVRTGNAQKQIRCRLVEPLAEGKITEHQIYESPLFRHIYLVILLELLKLFFQLRR